MMEAPVDLLRREFGAVHALLDPWTPAAPRSLTSYGELVVLEDVTVQPFLAGCAPLALSTWRGRTGLRPLPTLLRLSRIGQPTWHLILRNCKTALEPCTRRPTPFSPAPRADEIG